MSPGRAGAGAEAVAALGFLGLGRQAGAGSEMGLCVCVCVCCIPLLFLVHSWGLSPIQQVASGGTLKSRGVSKPFSTSGKIWSRVYGWEGGWGPEEGRKWRGRLASLRIGFKEVSSPNG